MRRWLNAFGWVRQALVHIQTRNALGRCPRPSSTVLGAHSTVSASVRNISIYLGMGTSDRNVFSSYFSTQRRRAQI